MEIAKKDTCKGLFWRGSVSTYVTDLGLTIGVKKMLRFLKKKSCPGCAQCQWVLEHIDEDTSQNRVMDYIGDIKQGAVYTYEVDGDKEGIERIYFVEAREETYQELKERQLKEIEALPLVYAFNDDQLKEGMLKLGILDGDTTKVCHVGMGGYMLKKDHPLLYAHLERARKEFDEAVARDKTGEGFIYDAFDYELANHEYCITMDETDAIEALGFTKEDIAGNAALRHGLRMAKANNGEMP